MLPYGKQCIDEDDIAAVAEVLRGDYLTTGPKIKEFEQSLCAATGAKHAVVCGNGTQALHLAALALGIGEGDAVIVPTVTFLATANAVRYCGAEVIFADVNPNTGLLEPEHIEQAMARADGRTVRAVFPVHLKGLSVDAAAIRETADRHGLKVVTDSCHALGTMYGEHPVGSCAFEDMATFSFHPVKTIAMGEGGAITTSNPDWAEKMARLRTHGMLKTPAMAPWAYEMPELGYNYRATDMQCALGVSQMKKLARFVERRRTLANLYTSLLAPLAPVVTPPPRVNYCNPAWHLYAVQIDFAAAGIDRATLMKRMAAEGVGSQVHYIPVHSQPYYRDRYGDIDLPGARHYYERTLSLPLYPDMSEDDVRKVVATLRSIVS